MVGIPWVSNQLGEVSGQPLSGTNITSGDRGVAEQGSIWGERKNLMKSPASGPENPNPFGRW